MCFFITIAVPGKNVSLVSEAFRDGFHILPTANPAVASALPAGYAAMLITNGHCSCGLYACPLSETAANPEDRLRKKYAKRGWSGAKVARAVEQAKASGSKGLHGRGLHPDIVSRLQGLCRAAGSVAVVVHWYSGQVETETLSLKRAAPCNCDEIPARAANLPEDEVLVAAARRPD